MSNTKSEPSKLLVVIVNYFSTELVNNLVKQLCKQELPSEFTVSIICADNSGDDEQQQRLSTIETTSDIALTCISNPTNLGFGKAINKCVEGHDFDYLCCINPDVVLFPETLSSLLKHSTKNNSQGIWGGVTVDKHDHPDFRHAWQEPSMINTFAWATGLSRLIKDGSWQLDYQHVGDQGVIPYAVDCISGCCLLISEPAWQAVNGFDTRFFLYSEEVDLCRRARQVYYQPTVVPNAKLKHAHHSAAQSCQRIIPIYTSKIVYVRKHHGTLFNVSYRLMITAGASLRAFAYLFKRDLDTAKTWAKLAFISLTFGRNKQLEISRE